MKVFILLLLMAIPIFSQKIWEIDVTGNGNLTDVREIPNSELLLFTYNTGRIEIRRSSDGSFVNQLISKPNESGDLRISKNGQIYFYQDANDTLEFRDIITNEPVIRVSPLIEELEGNIIFESKVFDSFELFENNTKLVGTVNYLDKDDSRNSQYRFIIYNLITKQIEYIEKPYEGKYNGIKKSYMSPDEKYLVELASWHPLARMFNLQTKTYEKEMQFEGELEGDKYYLYHALLNGKIENSKLSYLDPVIIVQFSFPELERIYSYNIFSTLKLLFSGEQNQFQICNDIITAQIAERIGSTGQNYYNYFMKIDLNTEQIIYSSKNTQVSLEYRNIFPLSDCDKIIIERDFDNRDGIITCYNQQTLDVIPDNPGINYISKIDKIINFSSTLFTGQLATIDIYNSVGAKVGNLYNGIINQSNLQFQIPDLPSGAYYLQCQLPTQTLNFNFVVVR